MPLQLESANFKLDPTVRGSRCSPHTAAQFGVRPKRDTRCLSE